MNQSIYLIGSEDVRTAGYAMERAATEMKSAANNIDESLRSHQRFLDDWLMKYMEVVRTESLRASHN
jgi:hypothetical protein